MSAPIVEIIAKPTNEVLKCKQVAGSGTLNRMDPSSPSDFSLDSGFDSPSSSFPSSPESWHLTNTAALFPTLPARTPEHTPEDSVPPKASQKSSVQEDRAEAQADARVSPDTSNCAQSSTSLCASETLSQCSFEVSSDSAKHIDERYYIQCEWSGCQKAVLSDNDLYDHVLVEHIKVLQGLQKNGEESKAPAEGDGGEDNRFGCKWGACEMNLTRGDDSKK
ncbi:hypothetical protein L596_003210 [Steinernema carpocapsae]|uniref:C2H2-type domain-containing protein n=1 Tax=Steinernema carpocapsae TaxID=34508 RepID=A0A4U8URR4_STECR|nr:hypothetical protein L596_003210 [Steinernema carpocapsae]